MVDGQWLMVKGRISKTQLFTGRNQELEAGVGVTAVAGSERNQIPPESETNGVGVTALAGSERNQIPECQISQETEVSECLWSAADRPWAVYDNAAYRKCEGMNPVSVNYEYDPTSMLLHVPSHSMRHFLGSLHTWRAIAPKARQQTDRAGPRIDARSRGLHSLNQVRENYMEDGHNILCPGRRNTAKRHTGRINYGHQIAESVRGGVSTTGCTYASRTRTLWLNEKNQVG
jgi:hypothetical protein